MEDNKQILTNLNNTPHKTLEEKILHPENLPNNSVKPITDKYANIPENVTLPGGLNRSTSILNRSSMMTYGKM